MYTILRLYSDKPGEISRFLNNFFNIEYPLENDLFWEKTYENPIEICDIISVLNDNNDNYKINIWISMDKDVFFNINNSNINKIIRYLFERYPY